MNRIVMGRRLPRDHGTTDYGLQKEKVERRRQNGGNDKIVEK